MEDLKILKKINMIRARKGSDLLASMTIADLIELSRNRADGLFVGVNEPSEDICYIPPLAEGTLVITSDDDMCISFCIQNDDFDKIRVYCECFTISHRDGKRRAFWDYSALVVAPKFGKMTENIEILLCSPEDFAGGRKYAKKKEIYKMSDLPHIQLFLRVIAYINFLFRQNKQSIREKSKKTNDNSVSLRYLSKRKNVIDLNNIYIYKNEDHLEKREYTRSGIGWTVRGHYRHLKSGKVVYVRQHKKGGNDFRPKKYKI